MNNGQAREACDRSLSSDGHLWPYLASYSCVSLRSAKRLVLRGLVWSVRTSYWRLSKTTQRKIARELGLTDMEYHQQVVRRCDEYAVAIAKIKRRMEELRKERGQ